MYISWKLAVLNLKQSYKESYLVTKYQTVRCVSNDKLYDQNQEYIRMGGLSKSV